MIVGSYLAEMGLCCGEDIVGKLQFGEIVDDCDSDAGPWDIENVNDGSVDFFAMGLSVCDGVDGANQRFWRVVRPVDECDDCGDDGGTLRAETYKVEDDAGTHRAYRILAFEIGNEGREDSIWGFNDKTAENARGCAAYVRVVVSKVGGYARYLWLEEGKSIAAEGMVRIGAAFDGNDAVERQCSDGRILVIDGLHDIG